MDLQTGTSSFKLENRAMVLKHSACESLPSMVAQGATEPTSSLQAGSPEVERIKASRSKFFLQPRKLHAAGLPTLTCQSLSRLRTSGDALYVARTCGIPGSDAAQLDKDLACQVTQLLGLNSNEVTQPVAEKVFLRGTDGGLGFQRLAASAAAAYAASWHACAPKIINRLGLGSVGGLTGASPWAARCIPVASKTLQEAVDDPSTEIGDTNVLASQRLLALAPPAAARDTVHTSLAATPIPAAALRSSGGNRAFTWMLPPSEPAHQMTDAQFNMGVRHRLCLPVPRCSGYCQHRRPDGSICGAFLDVHGIHARYCPVGGWLLRRHDGARDILGDWCEENHCVVQREIVLPMANAQRAEARMDLVVYCPESNVPAYLDVSIVSALSQEARASGSAKHDGKASEIVAKGKRKDYPLIHVTPFIVEDHGRFGSDSVAFLKRVAPSDPAARSRAISDLYHRLGAFLQRAAADAVLAAIGARHGVGAVQSASSAS